MGKKFAFLGKASGKLNPVQGGTWPLRSSAGTPAHVQMLGCSEQANHWVLVFPEINEQRGTGFTERSIR